MDLIKDAKKSRRMAYKNNNIRFTGFFKPFESLSDARDCLKSPIMIPIIDTTLFATNALKTLGKLGKTVVNIAFLDFTKAKKSGIDASSGLVGAVFFAVCALVDTLRSLIALATRTLCHRP